MSEGIRKVIKYDLWCAENAISGLLDRTRRWQVSIPVQDDDTDVILSKPIGHARHLLSEVERLTANYDALVTEGLQSAAKYEQLIADLQAERDALEAEASVYRVTVLAKATELLTPEQIGAYLDAFVEEYREDAQAADD